VVIQYKYDRKNSHDNFPKATPSQIADYLFGAASSPRQCSLAQCGRQQIRLDFVHDLLKHDLDVT
jgi:hypothetical protein